jgi:hypothetical protein
VLGRVLGAAGAARDCLVVEAPPGAIVVGEGYLVVVLRTTLARGSPPSHAILTSMARLDAVEKSAIRPGAPKYLSQLTVPEPGGS